MNASKFFVGLVLSLFAAATAVAQETPASVWGDSVGFKSQSERAIDLATAEAIERKRNGGYGPNGTQIDGDYNSYSTYEGPVTNTSNSSTNCVNCTDNNSEVTSSGSGQVGITYSTGATSYRAEQDAKAQSAQTDLGDNGFTNTEN